MGEVGVTLKIMPENPEVELDRLEKKIREKLNVQSVIREPVAFGLEALLVKAVIPDAAGGADSLEKILSEMPGVGNVQVVALSRLL